MIWEELLPDDPDMTLLHLVRRNQSNYRQVLKDIDRNSILFYRDGLPIAMTPNEDIKDLIRRSLPETEYDMKGSMIMTYREHLPRLLRVIGQYFCEFQL